MNYLAHSKNMYGLTHSAKEHLEVVAKLATEFAEKTSWSDEVHLAAILHDLGKYADLFQARLRGEASGLDHWSAGAWVALREYQAVAAALAIQGHHTGLQRGGKDALGELNPVTLARRHPLNLKLSDENLECLKSRAVDDSIKFEKPEKCIINPREIFKHPIADMLDVRMLFSCLTDADFIDTEAHFKGIPRDKGPTLGTAEALQALKDFMAGTIRNGSKADQNVLDSRNSLWEMVTNAADRDPGLLTLTAPTGSGKTLAMLKFALGHAARNPHLKRIILAVPFLSIIEQTAAIYRSVFHAFPDNYVLEHHSLAGLGSEEAKNDAEAPTERARRLLSENWDAPIIITTNVQLLESLFSNRPSV